MTKLRKNKGVILITTLMVATVLFILSGAYIASSIVQNTAVEREKGTLQAFYAAEKGVEYAFIESQNQGYGFKTHQVDNLIDLNLVKVAAQVPQLNGVILNATTGCYEISTASGKTEIKAYADPNKADETIILSRGNDIRGNTQRIIKFRISRHSMYQNFFFWPTNFSTSGNYNGKTMTTGASTVPIGTLYVKGNMSVNGGTYTNFAQIKCTGNIYYNNSPYNSPYLWDRRTWNDTTKSFTTAAWGASPDGKAPLSRGGAPTYYYNLPTEIFKDVSMRFEGWNVTDDWNDGTNNITNYGSWQVNGKSIPKQLPGSPTSWSWKKYADSRYSSEQAVRFEVTNDSLQWLVNHEENVYGTNTINEYTDSNWTGSNWLKSGDSFGSYKNGRFENSEADRVTLLSQETENGPITSDGLGAGFQNHSEYEIYKAVQSYKINGNLDSVSLPSEVETWIEGKFNKSDPKMDDFFNWWKARQYHHQEILTPDGTSYRFANDNPGVSAYERIFWEAWINYWPPAVSATGRTAKNHNEGYTPSQSNAALNTEWWGDLKYGNDRESTETSLSEKYLNSEFQTNEFRSWLQSKGLEEVIKFQQEKETPLTISSYYPQLAKGDGLYIRENDGTFTVRFNGGTTVTGASLPDCLSAAGLTDWVSIKQFYNPVDSNENYTSSPHPVSVIELNMENLITSSNNIGNHVVYIDSASYDTRIVKAATLPSGGLTVISPFDVYVQAQNKNIPGVGVTNAFNYEVAEKTSSTGGPDTNWQPAAIISNSKVYFLSSQFNDITLYVPYPDNFPRNTDSLREDAFLQNYCYENWPTAADFPAKPASKGQLTWSWIQTNLTNPAHQQVLYNNGEAKYDVVHEAQKINTVTNNNYFNVAVATSLQEQRPLDPKVYYDAKDAYGHSYNYNSQTSSYDMDPKGNTVERWASGKELRLEGAFIKLGEIFPDESGTRKYRYHKDYGLYEKNRYSPALSGNYAGTRSIGPSRPYEYEERFWSTDGRPAGDFFSGSQQRWQEVDDFEHHAS